jgi:urease accessory protein
MNDETFHRGWHEGDVIHADDTSVLVIAIIPCACISVSGVSGVSSLVRLGYEIGNRHAPFFYGGAEGEFLLPYDEPMQLALEKLGYRAELKETRLLPEKRISSAHGQHAHGHHEHSDHDHGGHEEHEHSHERE